MFQVSRVGKTSSFQRSRKSIHFCIESCFTFCLFVCLRKRAWANALVWNFFLRSFLIVFFCFEQKSLPSGVRIIFKLSDGSKVKSVQQFCHSSCYVCSSTDTLLRLDYESLGKSSSTSMSTSTIHQHDHHNHHNRSMSHPPQDDHVSSSTTTTAASRRPIHSNSAYFNGNASNGNGNGPCSMSLASFNTSTAPLSLSLNIPSSSISSSNHCNGTLSRLKPKLVALLRGACRAAPFLRPSRLAFRFLINHRTVHNYDQLLNEVSKCVKLNSGPVHCMVALKSGKKVSEVRNNIEVLNSSSCFSDHLPCRFGYGRECLLGLCTR